MTTSALNIASIKRNAGTQFRTDMCSEQVEGLTDLIERGVQWKTPIQVARFDGVLFLTDGFHRVEAYESAGYAEIPAGQYEVVECDTMNDVIMLAMRANAAHGKHNSTEDRVLMMNKLIQMDEKRFMPTPWEIAVKEVADALQITIKAARVSAEPKNAELKEKRDAAILELHKEGKSNTTIGKSLGMSTATVGRILERLGVLQNAPTAFSNTLESSTSAVPMASTEDRSETREDARSFIDEQLDALLDPGYIDMGDAPFSLTDDEADAPAARFDVLAATGYGEDLCQYTKPSKPATEYEQVEAAKANPVKLQEEWMELCDEEEALKAKLAEIIQRKSQVRRIATQSGVALPE
ncbi:ParB N-terminal domain-containing protein [Aeromonas hydrophila]|uniref:ParB N-terminal domain-containing protein n=1 Tax=Aeromonas hydrophila TaxID=644 RepID=UPI0035BAC1F1